MGQFYGNPLARRMGLPGPITPDMLLGSDMNGITGRGPLTDDQQGSQTSSVGVPNASTSAPLDTSSLPQPKVRAATPEEASQGMPGLPPQVTPDQMGGQRAQVQFPQGGPLPGSQAQVQFPQMGNLPPQQQGPPPQQPQGPQPPPQGSPSGLPPQVQPSQLVNQIAQGATQPPPLPKRPGAWRQIAATLAGMSPAAGLAPMIEYGPKGLQQIQDYQRWKGERPGSLQAGQLASQEADRQSNEANRLTTTQINQDKAKETERKDAQTAYDSAIKNIQTESGESYDGKAQLQAGQTLQTIVNPATSKQETYLIRSKAEQAQSKKQAELEAKQSEWQPLGDEITAALKMPKGLKVPPETLPHYATAYLKTLESKNPTETSIAMQAAGGDPMKALQLLAQQKAAGRDSSNADRTALDRETARFAKPHEKAVADASSQLEKIDDARAMINGPAEAQALGIPKVLTAVVSGQGTGVRITKAELDSIIAARGIEGTFEGFINKVSGQGSLAKVQQQQLTQILDDVKARVIQKQAIAREALDGINGAGSREEVLRISKDANAKLAAFEKSAQAAPQQAVSQKFQQTKTDQNGDQWGWSPGMAQWQKIPKAK